SISSRYFNIAEGRTMKSTSAIWSTLVGIALSFTFVTTSHAVASRTWVASNGDDTNTASNCGRTTPCKTFASAYSVTSAAGEIVALDTAGYGPITINSALSIVALQSAIITVQSNTVGVTINAGAGNMVTLRNIAISAAAGATNTIGIKLNTGKVFLQNSSLKYLTDGFIADSLNNSNSVIRGYIVDTDIIANTRAVTTKGTGTDLNTGNSPHPAGNVSVLLNKGNVIGNGTAFRMENPGNTSGNHWDTMWLMGYSNSGATTNVIGNTTVFVGTPTGAGQ